jgi:hypothetical protein
VVQVLGRACQVVQRHAVEMSETNDDLQGVAEAAAPFYTDGGGKGQRAPDELPETVSLLLGTDVAR